MKVVQASLGDRKDVESIFHKCGGSRKLLHTSLGVQENPKSSFRHCAGLVNSLTVFGLFAGSVH